MSLCVLVTGASGFLGAHTVRHLRDRGHTPICIARAGGIVAGVEVVPVDLTDRASVVRRRLARSPIDGVVHLAAALPERAAEDEFRRSHDLTVAIDSTVTSFCRENGLALVYASGTAVYGSMASPTDEHSATDPPNLYAAAKLAGEVMCRRLECETGIPTAILRISAPYGPGGRRPTVVNRFVERAMASEDLVLHGTGARTQDFTFVADVACALTAALERRASGTFNVATGTAVSMRRLAELAIAAVPGSRSRIVTQDDDPQESFRADLDVSKARVELGWTAETDLPAGLRQLIEHSTPLV